MIVPLVATARLLAGTGKGRPRQADLQRAVSTAYYALFHVMADDAASLLVGSGAGRPNKAWSQAYRSLDHGAARSACQSVAKLNFPPSITGLADIFVALQQERHLADYDPDYTVRRAEVETSIERAERAIAFLQSTPKKDRIAFAVLLHFKRR
jgi:hypothetical protein